MSDFNKFSKDIDRAFEKKVVQRFLQFRNDVVQTSYDALTVDSRTVGLVHGSPVLSGRFAGSWTVSIGEIDRSVQPPDLTGGEERVIRNRPASYVSSVLSGAGPFERIILGNALPYARRIEQGHSKLKAPEGVVEVTAEYIEIKFRNVK